MLSSMTSKPLRPPTRMRAAPLQPPLGAGVSISRTASPPIPVGRKLLKNEPIQ